MGVVTNVNITNHSFFFYCEHTDIRIAVHYKIAALQHIHYGIGEVYSSESRER